MGVASSKRSSAQHAMSSNAAPMPRSLDFENVNIDVDMNRKYAFKQIDGEYTVVDLVELEHNKDSRYFKIRKRELPDDFWVLWRFMRNRRRTIRNREQRRKRNEGKSEEELAANFVLARKAGIERAERLREGFKNGVKIVVDCSFASSTLSNDREIRSLSRQLTYCLAANRKALKPGRLIFAGFSGALKAFSQEAHFAAGWKAEMKEESAVEVIPPGSKVIMMSPDAEEALDTVSSDTYYVIGGLVDRTVVKNFSKNVANEAAWQARRLPLQEYLGMNAVLNVNDVVGALLLVHSGVDWKEALEQVVPRRRRQQGQIKQKDDGGGSGGADRVT